MLLSLRPATPHDLPTIVTLMNAAFRGTGPTQSWNTEAGVIAGDRTTLTLLTEELAAKPHAHLLVADPAPAAPTHACVWLEPISPTTWYLGSLTVDPNLQNSGLGRQLLEAAEQYAVHHSATTIRMTVVNVRETLIAWYIRRGYHLTGKTQPFPYDDHRFGTPLRPDLHFVVLEKSFSQPTPS